jgi:hypothetical protein
MASNYSPSQPEPQQVLTHLAASQDFQAATQNAFMVDYQAVILPKDPQPRESEREERERNENVNTTFKRSGK